MNWDRGGWGRTHGSEERTRWRLRGPFTGFPNLPKLPQDMRVNEPENNDTKRQQIRKPMAATEDEPETRAIEKGEEKRGDDDDDSHKSGTEGERERNARGKRNGR